MPDEMADPAPSPVLAGVTCRCPRCGEGKLFDGYLTLAKRCDNCGLDLAFADSGDGPAVFVIFIVGFLVVGGALVTEVMFRPPYWLHALIWAPLAIGLPLLLLRPAKGLMVAVQYRHDAAGKSLSD